MVYREKLEEAYRALDDAYAQIFYIPAAARMFRVEPPSGAHAAVAVLLGVLAVGWRLIVRTRSRVPVT